MPNPDMEARKDQILELIVHAYVETAEPVGSRTISRRFEAGLSPASIRNVMADLEDQGLITHPHTSAGRIPTDKGYRYYVDRLMEPETLTEKDKAWISSELSKVRTLEALAENVSKIISEITDNAALIYIKSIKKASFLSHLLNELEALERLNTLIEEEDGFFVEGVFRMFDHPEFQDAQKMRRLLQAFDEKAPLLAIFTHDLNEEGVQIHIGSETPSGDLRDVSLVAKDCYLGDVPIGGVAVVGPTRMHYSKVVSVVDFVADGVTEMVKRF